MTGLNTTFSDAYAERRNLATRARTTLICGKSIATSDSRT